MDKLELDLESLEVESFSTIPERDDTQGTVHGNEDSFDICPTPPETIDPCESFDICPTPPETREC